MYPKLKIDLNKIKQNLNAVANITKQDGGCTMMIVTKGFCADHRVAEIIAQDPRVDYLADSRVKNLKSYQDLAQKYGKETVLLRLPMECEIEETVEYASMSFNSERSTIRLLNQAAAKRNKRHKILLMIDLGDLREGIFFQEETVIYDTVAEILSMEHIELAGIGANLTCYGAVIPKCDNLSLLSDLAGRIEERFQIKLPMVSGGNSSSIYLIWNGGLPAGINNLRLGEAFLLGNDTAYGQTVPGSCHDAVTLDAQIIELKSKQSIPMGEIGVDAFGQKPVYEDRGVIKRAILAVGKQDIDIDSLTPVDSRIDILGGSSDHLILDVSKAEPAYQVGDVISFTLGYGSLLKASTSPYVEKEYIG